MGTGEGRQVGTEADASASQADISALLHDKISQAKARLLVEYPYFGMLASRLELRADDDIGSFLSDGTELAFNDEYLQGLSLDELGFVLSNGAMHASLAHDERQKGRMSWLWQLATDHAINAMLVENGLAVPKMINYEKRFEGLYAEEIYAILQDEIKNEAYDDDETNESGYNESNQRKQERTHSDEQHQDDDRPKMEVDKVNGGAREGALEQNEYRPQHDETLEEQYRQLLEESLQKYLDELPAGLDRFVEIRRSGVIDWRDELRHALDRHYRSDYRVLPPSKRLLYMGTYLPALDSQRLRLVIAIDSSGSVDEALLGTFVAEVESLMLTFQEHEIELVVCDSKIHSRQTFQSGDQLEYRLKGGGATDFRPVFELIDTDLPFTRLLLYFTDMQGRFPQEEPTYEVLWITASETTPPFGRVVSIR